MKKFILIATTASIIASSAFAKTEGNYVGVNILRASSSNQYKGSSGTTASNYGNFDDSSVGLGGSYKYAFNFNKMFLAPGVFFDKLQTKAKDKDGDTVSANYRYGAKADFGYDIADQFSAYLTAGFANTNYKVDWKSNDEKKTGSKLGFIAGIGFGYKITESFSVNFEYNIQSVDFKTPNSGTIKEVESKTKTAQIGVAYNF